MRQRTDGFIEHNAGMVEDFLELDGSFAALMRSQIRLPAHVDGIHVGREASGARKPEFIGGCGLQRFNGFGGVRSGRAAGVVAAEKLLRAKRGQRIELNDGIFRESLSQILH